MGSKHILLYFFIITGLAACSTDNRKFNIVADINGMPVQTVVLKQLISNDVTVIVDSQRSDDKGHFEFSNTAPEPGLYRLDFQSNKYILLSLDKGNAKITSNWEAIENYTINGSPASAHLKNFLGGIRRHLSDFNTMGIVLDTLKARGNDSMITEAKREFQDMKLGFTQFVEHYADTAHYQPNAVFAAWILNPYSEANYLASLSQSMGKRFPGTKMTSDFNEYYLKIATSIRQQSSKSATEVGNGAPEISLPDTSGTTVKLSSLKGKYVLIDFWASWCGPCRAENPNVVAAYNRYKDRNFTVLGVSLDNKKGPWMQAINADGLEWTQISDLSGWSSPAAIAYSVQSIPSNFLIDPTGKIIGRNLRGDKLEEMLSESLR